MQLVLRMAARHVSSSVWLIFPWQLAAGQCCSQLPCQMTSQDPTSAYDLPGPISMHMSKRWQVSVVAWLRADSRETDESQAEATVMAASRPTTPRTRWVWDMGPPWGTDE